MTLVLQHRNYLEKTALPMGALGSIGRMLTPSFLSSKLMPYAVKAEKTLGNAATRYLGATAGAQTKRLVSRVPGSAVRGAVGGAVFSGALGGGIGALTAEKGERTKGFLGGLGRGALVGGLTGGVSGTVEGLGRNLRAQALQRSGTAQNIPYKVLKKQMNQTGVFKSLGNLFNSSNPTAQTAARHKILGGTAAIAASIFAENYAYNRINNALGGEERPPPPPPPQNPPLAPNAPMIYSQPQYYKSSSDKTRLKPIDFTKMPRYHR